MNFNTKSIMASSLAVVGLVAFSHTAMAQDKDDSGMGALKDDILNAEINTESRDYTLIDLYIKGSPSYVAPPVLPAISYFDANKPDPTAVDNSGIVAPVLPYPDDKSGE